MGRVDGKIALVTGAGSGIGQAVAVRLAAEGATVVVTSRSSVHVEATCALIEAIGAPAPLGATLDVCDQVSIDHAVRTAIERFGRIDILSNNAGWTIRASRAWPRCPTPHGTRPWRST